jgi:hypothetical protein
MMLAFGITGTLMKSACLALYDMMLAFGITGTLIELLLRVLLMMDVMELEDGTLLRSNLVPLSLGSDLRTRTLCLGFLVIIQK